MRTSRVVLIAMLLTGCGAESTLKADAFAGRWPLAQVDGHALGWYHWTNLECQAAPKEGELVIQADRSWRFEMAYDYRCVGATSYDGSSTLTVSGDRSTGSAGLVFLHGEGPDLVAEVPDPTPWTLQVTPMGSMIQVRFTADPRYVWADPIFTLGPKGALQ